MNLTELSRYSNAIATSETMTKPHLREDAAQEGLINGWRASESRENATDAYLKKAVRNAVFDAVVRGRSTGSERPSGHHLAGEEHTGPLVVEGEHGPMLTVQPEDEATRVELDHVEVSDLRSRVRRAVRALAEEDRLHTYLRFWEGYTAKEVAAHLGKTEAYVAGRWNVTIRPALATFLATA